MKTSNKPLNSPRKAYGFKSSTKSGGKTDPTTTLATSYPTMSINCPNANK